MRITIVINNIRTAWREVSLSWDDAISEQFNNSVLTELDRILHDLDRDCKKMDIEVDNVNNKLRNFDSL